MIRKRLFRQATSYDRFGTRSGSHNTLSGSSIEGHEDSHQGRGRGLEVRLRYAGIDQLMREGRGRLEFGDLLAALKSFERITALAPAIAEGWTKRAQAL